MSCVSAAKLQQALNNVFFFFYFYATICLEKVTKQNINFIFLPICCKHNEEEKIDASTKIT
jgi:hypothetical protein